MSKCRRFLVVMALVLFSTPSTYAQPPQEAASYLSEIGEEYEDIRKRTWDYTSTMAHSRSARKVERKRERLIKTVAQSIKAVSKMDDFNGDNTLRDSVVAYLTLNYNVINEDYGKIMDMEAVAEQSYDLMEAYLLAQEKANIKLEHASARLDTQTQAFANKYGVELIESHDEISVKLKRSSEALKYYNQVYLVFFKAYKQELYLMDAIQRSDINAIEQNRSALKSFADEGIEKLTNIRHYRGDYSVNKACQRILSFYKEEAEDKIPIIADFLLVADNYKKMGTLMESKDRMQVTQEEVKQYNKAVRDYKKGVNKFNSTNNLLNNKRNNALTRWNNAVNSFLARHIPKK